MATEQKMWRKSFKDCEHKVVDGERKPWRQRVGNRLCGLMLPIGKRCTFKICPLKGSR